MAQGEARGFSRMLGNIDCIHWECKNYPFSCQGIYKGRAVSYLKLWCCGFRTLSSVWLVLNDINMLQRSPVFAIIVEGQTTEFNYEINEHQYTEGY